MRNVRLSVASAVVVALVLAGGCGHGQGYRVPYDPLVISASSLPTMSSGEYVDIAVPLTGGCGGPYVVALADGVMPPGLSFDVSTVGGVSRHHLVGYLMDHGTFVFKLRVTDTACHPDDTTIQEFRWSIPKGEVRFIGANPPLIPNAQYSASTDPPAIDTLKYPDADALQTVVYGTFTGIDLIAAGGRGPYVTTLLDDPADPDDGPMPLGMSLAVGSSSLVGTPTAVGPGGRPFRFTLKVTDMDGQFAIFKLQWKVDTPRILIATNSLTAARNGQAYSDQFSLVDGVPPLLGELTDEVPGPNADASDGDVNDDILWQSPAAPIVLSTAGGNSLTLDQLTGRTTDAHIGQVGSRTSYPLETDNGPSYGPYPSEGLYLVTSGGGAGAFVGVPRRRGDFTIQFHAFSSLVPNERGQHAFKKVTHHVDASEPPVGAAPAFGMIPTMAVENTFTGLPGDGFPTLPQAEQTVIYNPDATSHLAAGLECLAMGGVGNDGYTDAPHDVDRISILPTEPLNSYAWTANVNYDGMGAITGLSMFNPWGLFGTATQADADGLPRQLRRLIQFTVTDAQLPLSVRAAQTTKSQVFGIEVGPDKIITTYSTASLNQQYGYYSANQRHEWNDYQLKIMKFQGFTASPVRQALDASDLSQSHGVPAAAFTTTPSNPLGALLSGETGGDSTLDLHRPTVVATGWWDDDYGLSLKGARHGKHAHWQGGYGYMGQFGNSYSNQMNWQPSVPCLDLPDGEGVTANTAQGIYANGGRLYVFESANRFGIFVLRADASIYVPFAYQKDSTYECFGDGLFMNSALGVHSAFQTVQMTVSPNGRFAALKLKRDAQNFYENAVDSAIVLINLWGEKVFGESSAGANDGATYKIIGNGVAATGTGNRIQYASSMALTNTHLYLTIGQNSPSSTSTSATPMYYQSFSGHYFLHYQVLGGAAAASLMVNPGDTANWTQALNVPMQTTYHHHGPNFSSGGMWESYTFYGLWPYHRYWMESGMNIQEHGRAPTPFRCSADGKAVAFMAAQDIFSTLHADIYNTFAWVCYDGSNPRRATSQRKHAIMGSGRGYSLVHGPDEYAMWGRYNGPSPGLEISDDGLALAFVHNLQTGSIYSNQSWSSSSHAWMLAREDIWLCRTTSADAWATLSSTIQRDVTSSLFTGSHRWRFGCLHFTQDLEHTNGAGLIFWGGAPVYLANTTTYLYNTSYQTAGTFYSTALHQADMKGMLSSSEGGVSASTYTTSSPMNPSSTSGSTSSANDTANFRYGFIQPMGGFVSKNRKFLYVCSYGALSASDATGCVLVGLNVSTMDSGTVNGHTNGEGDIPGSWPSRRGFMDNYIYYPWYPLYYGYAPNSKQGIERQEIAKDTGWVYFLASWQYAGPGRYYYYGGPPAVTYYYGAYGYGGCKLFGFDANLNGSIGDLSVPAIWQDSTNASYYGLPQFLEVSRDGKRVVFGYCNDYYRHDRKGERIGVARDIDFNTTTGALQGFSNSSHTALLEATSGRNGEGFTFPSGNSTDVWYTFKSSANDETDQEMVRASLQGDGTWAYTRYSGLPGRMNALHGAR